MTGGRPVLLHTITRKTIPPPHRTIAFFYWLISSTTGRERANSKRCVYGNIATGPFQSHDNHFRGVCPRALLVWIGTSMSVEFVPGCVLSCCHINYIPGTDYPGTVRRESSAFSLLISPSSQTRPDVSWKNKKSKKMGPKTRRNLDSQHPITFNILPAAQAASQAAAAAIRSAPVVQARRRTKGHSAPPPSPLSRHR